MSNAAKIREERRIEQERLAESKKLSWNQKVSYAGSCKRKLLKIE